MEEKQRALSKASRISGFVKFKLLQLQQNPRDAVVRAKLAKMRRGIGEQPGAVPELWDLLFDGLPEELEGKGNEPSRAEKAVYTALTLYALHQQGKDLHSEFMYLENNTLGRAVGQLARRSGGNEEAVIRRFNVVVTSADLTEFSWHLRNIIQLCKRESIPLDYASLARDLYEYQDLNRLDNVRLKWGRDFYRELSYRENDEDEAGTGSKE